jgi:DNA-binding SARP family transcriptional activator/TolB-like protein
LLWSESTDDRARHTLAQLLHLLHRDLPPRAILEGTGSVRLNPEVIGSDVQEFERALHAGDLAQAVGLYRGPFLDGFYLTSAPEFERWVEGERVRLRHQTEVALTQLAGAATAQGAWAKAADWWRLRVCLDPLDSKATVGLMQSLRAMGDHGAALRCAFAHDTLLRTELDFPGDAEVTKLVREIREEVTAISSPKKEQPPPPVAVPDNLSQRGPLSLPAPPPPLSRQRRRVSRLVVRALTIAAVVGGVVVGWIRWTRQPTRAPVSPTLIAILPFSYHGASQFTYLDDGIIELLSNDLNELGEYRTVTPRGVLALASQSGQDMTDQELGEAVAERERAGIFVVGNVEEAGSRVRVSASAYGRHREEWDVVARSTAEEGETDLFRLADELAAQLFAGLSENPATRLAGSASRTTTSLVALRAFLEGERLLWAASLSPPKPSRYDLAVEAFSRAVAADSTFSLAHYRLSVAAAWNGDDSLAHAAVERALRHVSLLSNRDRALIGAWKARIDGDATAAEHQYRLLLEAYPDDVEAAFQLGDVLFHYNPLRGRPAADARPLFERVLRVYPTHAEALMHLSELAALEGDFRRFDSLITRGPSRGPVWQAVSAAASGDVRRQTQVLATLSDQASQVQLSSAVAVAAFVGDVTYAELIVEQLLRRTSDPLIAADGHLVRALLDAMEGRPSAAKMECKVIGPFRRLGDLEDCALLTVLPFLNSRRRALDSLRLRLSTSDNVPSANTILHSEAGSGLDQSVRRYLEGLIDARLGDTLNASREVRQLMRINRAGGDRLLAANFSAGVEAEVAWYAGKTRNALRILESDRPGASFTGVDESPFYSGGYSRFRHAEALQALGKDADALRWYGSLHDNPVTELLFAAPAHLHQAEIFEASGDRHQAVMHYGRVLRLLGHCEPDLRPLAARAEEGLSRLATASPMID